MFDVDAQAKQMALSPSRHVYARALFGTRTGSTWVTDRTYRSTDNLQSATVTIGGGSDGLTIGRTYCAKLTLTLAGDVTVNERDRVIVRVGFTDDEGDESKRLSLGWFYVDKIRRSGKATTVTAYDKMLRAAKNYRSQLTYPAKASDILNEICELMGGVEIAPDFAPAYDPQIAAKPQKGTDSDGKPIWYTQREILGFLGSMWGGNWFFDVGGRLAFTRFAVISDSILAANTTAETISKIPYQVTGISWTIGGQSYSRQDDVDADGVIEFYNPLGVTKEPVIHALEERLVGLSYYGGTLDIQGAGWYELGDIITAHRADGTAANILVTGLSYNLTGGGYTQHIISSSLSDSESNYTGGNEGEAISGGGGTISGAQTLTEYTVISDNVIKHNGTIYTFEVGDDGRINKVTTDKGGEFAPDLSGGTAPAFHNATFAAVALMSNIPGAAPEPTIGADYYYSNAKYYVDPGRQNRIIWQNQGSFDTVRDFDTYGDTISEGGVFVPSTSRSATAFAYGGDTVNQYTWYFCSRCDTASLTLILYCLNHGILAGVSGQWVVNVDSNTAYNINTGKSANAKTVWAYRRNAQGTLDIFADGVQFATTQNAAQDLAPLTVWQIGYYGNMANAHIYGFALNRKADTDEEIAAISQRLAAE